MSKTSLKICQNLVESSHSTNAKKNLIFALDPYANG